MNKTKDDAKSWLAAGSFLGAFSGLVITIMAAIWLMKPALVSAGLSSELSSFITLVTWFACGWELGVAGGAVAGAAYGALLFSILYVPYQYCTRGYDATQGGYPLRRPGHQAQGRNGNQAQAHGHGRHQANFVARDENLLPLRF